MSKPIAASGYKDIFATPLGKGVEYGGTIIRRNIEDSLIPYICNTTILKPLTQCAELIEFRKPAEVGAWRPYEMNQRLIPDEPHSDRICIQICNQAYKSIKIDKETIRRACNYWDAYEQEFLDSAWNNLEELLNNDVLTGMMTQVASYNIGKQAGKYRNIDLGSLTAPLDLTPDTIVVFFDKMKTVLKEAKRWYPGEMVLVIPEALETLLLVTLFNKQMCCNTGELLLFKGLVAKNILGFTVVSSPRLRPQIDPATKKLVYPVLAAWNEAYAHTSQIVEANLENIPQSFGVQYNMLCVYGGGVIYSDAMALAYASFSTSGLAP